MKRILSVILPLALLLSLASCVTVKEKIREPVSFYYRQKEVNYGANPSVVDKEIREASSHRHDYSYLISQYLKGPEDLTLYSPFPRNTALKGLSIQDGTAYVNLNSSFASLTGLDLTLACACITLTVCEMTGANQVTITAADSLLDGAAQITMTPDNLLMVDNSNIVIRPE